MTQYYPPPQPDLPDPGQHRPPKKPHTVRNVLIVFIGVILAGLVLMGGCVALIGGAANEAAKEADKEISSWSATPVPLPSETTAPKPAATTAPPAYATPSKAHFKLTVKTLTKECFGSAGCLVTYRILVTYNGPTLDPSKSYEVLYEVHGGEDGPTANRFTVEGGESSVPSEEMVSTRSRKAKLTAVVTDIL